MNASSIYQLTFETPTGTYKEIYRAGNRNDAIRQLYMDDSLCARISDDKIPVWEVVKRVTVTDARQIAKITQDGNFVYLGMENDK